MNKKAKSAQKTTLKKEVRLQKAKCWIATYTGSHIVKAYRKRYHVDFISAIDELRGLGVAISETYEQALRASLAEQARQRQQKLATKQQQEEDALLEIQDDHFSFIAGYTSGGAAYGIPWDYNHQEDQNDTELYALD